MFRVIKEYDIVNDMYTLHGYVGNPKKRNDRYIQMSPWTDRPIIQTRLGYSVGNVVCFMTEDQAYDFIDRYMKTAHVKYHINWKVVKYNPRTKRKFTFKESDSPFGKYYFVKELSWM